MKKLNNTYVEVKEYEKEDKIFLSLFLNINGFEICIKPAFELSKSQYRAFMLSIDKNTIVDNNIKGTQ